MLNRQEAPAIKDAIDFDLRLKPYEKFTLDNGVDVYSIHAGAEEVLQLDLVFQAGNWYETDDLVSFATNQMLKNGTQTRSAFEISEHFDYYGAYLNRNAYNETASVSVSTLSKHLPQLLPVMRDMITASVFPQEELDIFRQNMKQRLAVNLKKAEFVANRLIDAYLFGPQHPYGKFSKVEGYDALRREQLEAFYQRYYLNGHCTIFVSGRLPVDLQAQLNACFRDLPLNREPLPVIEHAILTEERRKFRQINDPEGVQGAIRIARIFPNRHHPDFAPAQVLNTLFGGFFGSRLMSNIREEKGYTYGIGSYLQNYRSTSVLTISTEAGRDVSEATVEEVYKEMELLREETVDDEELLVVKNYLLGTTLSDLDGPFQIMGRWKNIILNDLPPDYFYRTIAAIKAVTPEQLQELAKRYLNPAEFYELIVV